MRTAFAVFVLGSFALLSTPGTAAAQQPDGFAKRLDHGEFAAAWNMAQQRPVGPARDQMFQALGQAQARAGMLPGALNAAAQIDSDLARSVVAQDVAQAPVGQFGGLGGGSEPDFDSLIELITTTIAPTTWDEVGGPGSVGPFEGGVRVDAGGLVHSLIGDDHTGRLRRLRSAAQRVSLDAEVRTASPLRKVSLTRLEREVQLRLAAGKPLDEDMQVLAGLQRVEYVLVYPESGEILLAGPAGDWQADIEGRLVSVESGRPVLRLDDLAVLLRHMRRDADAPLGCSIVPLQANLAATQAFLKESAGDSIKSSQRGKWLETLRSKLGQQAVEYYGIDPQTRIARVMFEADYRMKLVGIGLEPGTPEVRSYLELLDVPRGQAPPPMGVLRWWFALNYDAILASAQRDAFQLRGQGVQVLSENEMLTKTGERVHTGKSEVPTAEFAARFTRHFEQLAAQHPVYAELQNIFDLSLVSALIAKQHLDDQVGWHMTCFASEDAYPHERGFAPQRVESVMNHKIVNRVHILAAVSGGVRCDPARLVTSEALKTDTSGQLVSHRSRSMPKDIPRRSWWWD